LPNYIICLIGQLIYTICPSKILNESGQVSAITHYNNLNNYSCISASTGINAALIDISTTIMPVGCEASASGNFSVLAQNLGTELLNNFTVELSSGGQSIGTVELYWRLRHLRNYNN